MYDEICRSDWCERAARGDIDFDVNIESRKLDNEILARAKLAYDAGKPRAKPAAAASKHGLLHVLFFTSH